MASFIRVSFDRSCRSSVRKLQCRLGLDVFDLDQSLVGIGGEHLDGTDREIGAGIGRLHGRSARYPVLIVLEKRRDRRRRHIEYRFRIDSERYGQHDERSKRYDLARTQIEHMGERWLVEHAEDNLAIEPQGIA